MKRSTRTGAALALLLLVLVTIADGLLHNMPIDTTSSKDASADNDVMTVLAETGAEYRLPQTVHPEHYKLEVITHLNDTNDGFRFSGRVWIKVRCSAD